MFLNCNFYKNTINAPPRDTTRWGSVSHGLCRSSQVRIRDALGGFGVGLFDDVGVDIHRGGHGGMPEALRHGDDIRALINEN